MNNRNLLISVLQVWGILLVVIGHSFYGNQENIICIWIYTFHMPLFVFISGYLLKYTTSIKGKQLSEIKLGGWNGFIWKKIKHLMFPYIVISTIAFYPKILLSHYAIRPVEFSLIQYLRMLIYPWDNVIIFFWFLPTIFLILTLTVCCAHLVRHVKIPISLKMLLVIVLLFLNLFNPLKDVKIFNISGVAQYAIYFVIGYYSCQKGVVTFLKDNAVWGVCITLCLSILLVKMTGFEGKNMIMALNGIVMSLFIGQNYINYNCRFWDHLFGASYAIYLLSWFPQVLAQQVFLKLTNAPWMIGSFLAIVSGIYVPWLIYKWIASHKNNKLGKIAALLTGQ